MIAQVKRLTDQGVDAQNIILKGNCLGAWISGAAQDELSKQGIMVRGVRSNTFSNLDEVVLEHTPSVFKHILRQCTSLMKPLGWSYDASEASLVNGPFVLMVNREGDGVIPGKALLSSKVAQYRKTSGVEEEAFRIPGYEQDQKFFDQYGSSVHKKEGAKGDPHVLKFNDLEWKDDVGQARGGQDLFAEYIARSDRWIRENPQEVGKSKAPQFKGTTVPVLDQKQQKQASQLVAVVGAIERSQEQAQAALRVAKKKLTAGRTSRGSRGL